MGEDRSRVLVVDDDPAVRDALRRALGSVCEVVTAEDGEVALGLLGEEGAKPDLVFLDVRMPGMDGYEVCRRLQANPELAYIPVVFLTVLESEQDRRHAFAAGASGYLQKPVEREDLLAAVREQLSIERKWRQLREGRGREPHWLVPSAFQAFKQRLLTELGEPSDAAAVEAVTADRLYALAPLFDASEEQIARHVAHFLELPYIDRIHSDQVGLGTLPSAFCRANLVVPLKGGTVVVASPFHWELMDVLERTLWTGDRPDLALTAPETIVRVFEEREIAPVKPESTGARVMSIHPDKDREGMGEHGEGPVHKLANEVIFAAIHDGASDIHLEPKDSGATIRFRLDGDLREIRTLPAIVHAKVVSRLKVLAGMDIAERRKPQDGVLEVELGERRFRLRLATSGTPHGESLVVRILEPDQSPVPLENLGLADSQSRELRKLAQRSQGTILVVGSTGSGKSTTIYTLLSSVDGTTRSIMSVEDPIEYRIAYANQQQVNLRAGVTFESLLKSAMRQDPDVLFLGEVRDAFSARALLELGSSGHLTISTLHSSNATTAIFRLERLGVERGAIADAVTGILAQKLLPKLCERCREVGPPTSAELELLAPYTHDLPAKVARPIGCPACRETGYRGREAVCELLPFDAEVSRRVREGDPIAEIRQFCQERGDPLVVDHALEKVWSLKFSVEDVYAQVLVEDMERIRRSPSASASGKMDMAEHIPGSEEAGVAPTPDFGERAGTAADGGAPGGASAPGSAGPLVLVVDDDRDLLTLAEFHLKNAGFRVVTASDGVEALMELARRPVDLLLSDINMPNLDGMKLMEVIAQKKIDVPTVFLSGADDDEIEARVLALGAADFLKKPLRKELLLLRLRNVLRLRGVPLPAGAE